MTAGWRDALDAAFPGRIRREAPLAPFTTYRIGGPADALFEPASAEEVQRALAVARGHGVPWLVLGLGSNVLVADAGVRGLVLRMGRALAAVERMGALWLVGAGLPTPLFARRTATEGMAGVHRLVGVPGTVGGGVYMNAGAHAQEFRQVVRRVTLVNADGDVEDRAGDAIPWAYRSSGLGPVVVLGAAIELEEADPVRLRAEVEDNLRWRKEGTPFSEPCCGSVFRNPGPEPGAAGQRGRNDRAAGQRGRNDRAAGQRGRNDGAAGQRGSGETGGELRTAGQLIDAAGMKGFRVGGAEVSPVHANYIVNTGGASASDVMAVIDAVRARVRDEFGVELELEVKIIESR
jgi:UDP-N-acetylmuramate dehydrogenase